MTEDHGKGLNTFRPETKLDDALQAELDDALGEMSLEDLIDTESAPATPGQQSDTDLRTGRVLDIQGDDIFVDLGGKDQGILPAKQFENEPLPAVGDLVEVTVQGDMDADGLLRLARKGAIVAASWDTLEKGQIVEAHVKALNTGGLELSMGGIRAFMPLSQIEQQRVDDLKPYIGKKLRCEVVEVKRAGKSVVVSRRAVLAKEAAAAVEQMLETMSEGQTVPGTVRTIMPYGAFVDIGGVDGLLHVSDMSYARIEDPGQLVAVGQQVEVKILKIDPETKKISLGLKQTMPDPWEDAEAKWAVDDVVTGRVTRIMDFGVFVELEKGVEGLVPMGELSFERRVHRADEIVSPGDTIKVRVLGVDLKRKRISLSLKRVGDDPWVGASARWAEQSTVTGIVKRIADFGAFVELVPGVEGMVHISELSESHVRTVSDVLEEGQTVQAKVLGVDEDARRISLSIKALAAAQATEYAADPEESEAPRPQPKRKKSLKGGLDHPGGWGSLGDL